MGSRHPEKVAGLIYLDAGYSYAFYDRSRGDLTIDSIEVRDKLAKLQPGSPPQEQKQAIQELLETSLPQLERLLKERQKDLEAVPAQAQTGPPIPTVSLAILTGQRKYTEIRVPTLAIFALPHGAGPGTPTDPAARAAQEARELTITGAQVKAFEAGVPGAHVIRLPNANHYVFRSNEDDVLREMKVFLENLKPTP